MKAGPQSPTLRSSTSRAARPSNACDWVERAVVFHLGSQRYGIPIEQVNEIQQIVAFSDVPSDGFGVVGMVNLRGDVVPAIDVRRLVGMDELAYTLETPMIITRSGDHVVALIVDEVEDVVRLPEGCLQAASPMHALSNRMIGVARLDRRSRLPARRRPSAWRASLSARRTIDA